MSTLKKDEDMEEASKIILEYMKNQNRPYAVTDIITNLHGAVGKTLAIKVLAKLAEEEKLMAKTFGKTIIYVIKQNIQEEEAASSEDVAQEKIMKDLESQVVYLSSVVKTLKDQLKKLTDTPTNEELAANLSEIKNKVEITSIQIKSNQNRSQVITVEQIDKANSKIKELEGIYKRRTKIAKELHLTIKENAGLVKNLEEALEWEFLK